MSENKFDLVIAGSERHGVKLGLMDEALWGAMSILPGGTAFFHISERALPGSLMYPGDIGTKGGILTDEFGRVIKEDGSVLEGFYATGNTTSSVMGRSYPGAGATIAASMTFGFLAVKHMVGEV